MLAFALSVPLDAQAINITWDANAAVAGQTNGAGAWLNASQWFNGVTNVNWTSGDDAIFGGPATAGGAVTLASPTTVNSLTFNTLYTGTYTLGTAGQTITLNNGITKNVGSGIATIISPILLGGAQTWTNNSSTNINVQAATTLNGALTVGGSGTTDFTNTSGVIGGAGGIIKNGTGQLNLSAGGVSPAHTFTGDIVVNGGSIGFQTSSVLTGRNVNLTNGYLGGRFNSGFTWSGGLGAGANQIQITGGTSGFSGEGNTVSTFQIGTALSTLKWGAAGENGASGFFNPTVLLANGDVRMNVFGKGSLNNGIDLNGTTRTITSLHTTDGAATSGFTINGIISNSTGTAGLIKTGIGNLRLNGANTYNGGTTLNQGSLTAINGSSFGSTSGTMTVNAGLLNLNGQNIAVGNLTGTGGTIAVNGGATALLRTLTIGSGNTGGGNYQGTITNNTIAGNTGTLALTKIGNGLITLSGNNTYTGATDVNAGTLLINGTLGNTNVNIASGGTFGGSGSILGSITLNAGGTLAPGSSIESLVSGSNFWSGGSSFEFEFSTDGSGVAGIGYDLLTINGALSLVGASSGNPITIDLVTMLNATTPGSLVLWDPNASTVWAGFVTTTGGFVNFSSGSFAFNTAGFQNPINGTFSVVQNQGNLDLVYTTALVIPEPATATLGLLGLAGLMLRRRRMA